MSAVISGLAGVVVAETQLSRVDGEAGELVIRGYRVGDLAGRHDFPAICALLWTGDLGGRPGLAAELGAAREAAWALVPSLGGALNTPDGMDALRAGLGHVPSGGDPAALRARLVGAVPVLAAAWWRGQQGLGPVAPSASRSHAADYLAMLSGVEPDAARVAALDGAEADRPVPRPPAVGRGKAVRHHGIVGVEADGRSGFALDERGVARAFQQRRVCWPSYFDLSVGT